MNNPSNLIWVMPAEGSGQPKDQSFAETSSGHARSGVAFVVRQGRVAAMKVTVNGEEREVPEGITVAGLLAELGIGLRGRAVELNKNIVFRHEHDATQLREGDRVEIITMVGGG